jgi:4-hydroxy-tetrahydrodipicolinate reductase
MKIALVGYGKMGRIIEQVALAKGHEIVLRIDLDNAHELTPENLRKADVAIEFTSPHSALHNVLACLRAHTPVVCGSTGWNAQVPGAAQVCIQEGTALLVASNFSIGVNIFFALNRQLAKFMQAHADYDVCLKEIHHTQKKDAPSGTAITLAEDVLENLPRKTSWVNRVAENDRELTIISERTDPAPGTHIVTYTSAIDDIEISHTAHNREGFAKGAVLAAEYIHDKKGVFTMNDVLQIR